MATKKPVNFESKSQRKATRKQLVRKLSVRGVVANGVAGAKAAARERAQFYRDLREMKLRRRKIAAEWRRLADMLATLKRDLQRVVDRAEVDVDRRVIDETGDMINRAWSAADVAADEYYTFSRKRIFFTEVTGRAAA